MKTNMGGKTRYVFLGLLGCLLLAPLPATAAGLLTDYAKSPAFVVDPLQPLTMLLLDNTGSMGDKPYSGTTYSAATQYYGLFEKDKYYYHPFASGAAVSTCTYTGISGSCSKTTGSIGDCTYPGKNCTGNFPYYTCYRPAGITGSYNSSTCDGPDADSNSDCPGGSSNCKSSTYTCRSTMTVSSTYKNSSCDNSCSGGATCVQDYSCYKGTNNSGAYGNSTCDGTDSNSTTDCASDETCQARSGRWVCYNPGGDSGSYSTSNCNSSCTGSSSCVTLTYGCQVSADQGSAVFDNSVCDGADSGTDTDCASGYSCNSTTIYHCTTSGGSPKNPDTMYVTSSCGSGCGSGYSCTTVATTNVTKDWSGQPCSTCPGGLSKCVATGVTNTVPSYDCLADSGVRCNTYDGHTCTSHGNTQSCSYADWVAKTGCENTYGPIAGGACTPNADVPNQTTGCGTTDEQAACTTLYHGTCASVIPSLTTRTSYWRKTPGAKANGNCGSSPSDPAIQAGSLPGVSCTDSGGKVTLGNQLNHDLMTQMDIAKKVLIGGMTSVPSSIAGAVELNGETNSTAYYTCTAPNNQAGGEYSSNTCQGGACTSCQKVIGNGNIVMQGSSDPYPDAIPHGVVQDFSGLSWGFSVLNNNSLTTSGTPDGGVVMNPIGDSVYAISPPGIIQNINDTKASGMTDLAESLNTVVNYFKQTTPQEYFSTEYQVNNTWDPFYSKNYLSYITCGRASTVLITDGEPNQDGNFNVTVKDYATTASGIADFKVPSSGTNSYWLDDVSYYAHKTDLRPSLSGDQKMDLYYIYAFGNNATMQADLQKTAVLGGFTERIMDGVPSTPTNEAAATSAQKEWDTDGDGIADNYANASEGDSLAVKLQSMLGTIQTKGASGSASSVIAASRSGEGAIYQAVFYPRTPLDSASRSIAWSGDVHAMWLDDRGNIREDCDKDDTANNCTTGDRKLSPKKDNIMQFYTDPTSGEAMIRLYSDSDGNNLYSPGDLFNTVEMKGFSHYLWSGDYWLARADATTQRGYTDTAAQRYIFTQNDSSGTPVNVPFTPAAMAAATGFASSYTTYMNAASTAEADKVVRFVRGEEIAGLRSRLYDSGDGGGALIHKLGDVVGSTPTIVAKPAESYDTLYADDSYRLFRNKYDKRRIMVYAGGNDGGLHAFNGGYYDRAADKFLLAPPTLPLTGDASQTYATQYALGSEMWMFIPKNLLPHLKWLADVHYGETSSNHVYYVDMRPYIFDAKIFNPSDGIHAGGWGTLMVCGMGFGGGDITVSGTTFRSAYFILDITDPEKPPVLLKEFTDATLGFTTSYPTAIPMLLCDRKTNGGQDCKDKSWPMEWYLAFGSGPYSPSLAVAKQGTSQQSAHVYVLDLGGFGATAPNSYAISGSAIDGSAVNRVPSSFGTWTIPAAAVGAKTLANSYFSELVAIDHDMNFKTDVLYFGSVANTTAGYNNYTGGVQRLVTQESTNPLNWSLNTLFNAGQPVSAAPSVGTDGSRLWVYFGTGRLIDGSDKSDSSQQSYYGLKESYDILGKISLTTPNAGNLVDVTRVGVKVGVKDGDLVDNITGAAATVKSTGNLLATPAIPVSTLNAKTFNALDLEMSEKISGLDHYNGWKINFSRSKERNLGQAALLGGVVMFNTYMPTGDACSADGGSYLWAAYYRTGTSYYKSVIGTTSVGGVTETTRDISIGAGMALTPSVHSGAEGGLEILDQTSSGAIIAKEVTPPGVIKSGVISWRDRDIN